MKTPTFKSRWLPLAAGLSLMIGVFAGCGSEEPATSAPTAVPTTAPTTSPTAPPTAAVAVTEAPSPTDAPSSTEAPAPTSPPVEVTVEVGHEAGQKAPDFMLTTVEGGQVSLGDFQDRPVMLYFYATW